MGLAAAAAAASLPDTAFALGEVRRRSGTRVKIALNAYSFNRPLSEGKMTLDDVIDYCALQDIDGVDPTGYYFPGYPNVPSDESIYKLKRKAFLNGVTLGGTGVRNDFALPDAVSRKGHIQLVKDWIDVAEKLGAAFVRVFSGRETPSGHTFDQVLEWMVPAFQECAEYGKQHGVIVALQHHDDFLKTAAETIRVVEAVHSEWFSVVLDVGSLRQGDPYEEIEKLLPYACTWQVKEDVWYGEKRTPIDLPRLKAIIDKVGYRGFLPIEALGRGDPSEVVTRFLEQVRGVFG
jgi:sugar phosphate isomerase/epimerase